MSVLLLLVLISLSSGAPFKEEQIKTVTVLVKPVNSF